VRGWGGFKEGKSGQRVTASTRHLQGAELRGGAAGGDWIQWWHGRAQATREEGENRWGPPVS
jgi:hypothetical protein